ncbi:NfeD family protein [Mangrovibacterium marinum]|uniref:Membrane protein implicated in regulation of membrane protease activity n=1 Tax=Mangrovibacterium marinum TaxID=1639118 RepID=A0A2T5C0L2_9BACT|nr:NfeD family protein [Mangrovibacterium marinum]PTN08088.1 membrane protein implicated in regulation of membrane protease activity [Mangrovibacterium marinum]
METWHLFVAIGIIAFILEIFTAGFISASVGIGFLFAAIGNWWGLAGSWQLVLFAFGVALTYLFVKPLMTRYGYRHNATKTNSDALIHKSGIVTEEINQLKNSGRIQIDGDAWKARSSTNEIIQVGTMVSVIDIESIVLIVKPLN